jgi:hypothetical protein
VSGKRAKGGSQAAFFGEIALMLWLVIKGATPPAQDATALSSAVA